MSSEGDETRRTNGIPSSGAEGQRTREQGHEGYAPDRDESPEDEPPTFLLDVPVLNIDEIDLEVEDLSAHVSLRAELASLVKINVGVDVYLDRVKLNLQGVEAQAILTVKLDRVLSTLDRALEAINNNPNLLNEAVQVVDPATGGAGRGEKQEARETGGAASRAPGPDRMLTRARNGPENATEAGGEESEETENEEITNNLDGLRIEEEYVDEWGRIVGRARDGSGNVTEAVLDEEGNFTSASAPEESGDREPGDDGEVDATDAARRKAGELGVRLSEVRGTGSGGRVLVKDVQRAAE